MLEKNSIAIEIGEWDIKVLAGNKNEVKNIDVIRTPIDSFRDDNITNVAKLAQVISDCIKRNRINYKKVSYTIHGQDIVIRHMETPILDKKGIWKALNWEVSQYLPDGGKDYYIDYEIIEKINTAEKKVLRLIVVSVPKEKVERYIKLTNRMKLQLSAIDISFNNACRVFKNLFTNQKEVESVGIIDIGLHNSNITILEKGNLIMEREVSFGIHDAVAVMYWWSSDSFDVKAAGFLKEFSFSVENENNNNIIALFNDVLNVFAKVIQFYTSSKANKQLDKIFIVGEGSDIDGINDYIQNYFSSPAEIMDTTNKIGLDTKLPNNLQPRYFVNSLGLMLRRE